MSANQIIGTRLEPGRIPMLEAQVYALTQALTSEVLHHAETKQKLLIALSLCDFDERIETAKEGA